MRLKPVDDSPLPWRPRGSQSERFRQFCKRFLRVPKGHGVGKPVILRDWQLQLVASVMDAEPRPRLAGWMIGRGNGKSSLLAMWAVFELFTYGQGASVVVCARSQDQARIIFNTARQFVEQSPELKARVQVARDRMYIPATFSSFDCLVSEPQALEGLDFSLCLVDEIGVTPKETVDVLMLAQGKRPTSTLVGIGTPPADPEGGVLHSWRQLLWSLATLPQRLPRRSRPRRTPARRPGPPEPRCPRRAARRRPRCPRRAPARRAATGSPGPPPWPAGCRSACRPGRPGPAARSSA